MNLPCTIELHRSDYASSEALNDAFMDLATRAQRSNPHRMLYVELTDGPGSLEVWLDWADLQRRRETFRHAHYVKWALALECYRRPGHRRFGWKRFQGVGTL